jgi:hypothetical protein
MKGSVVTDGRYGWHRDDVKVVSDQKKDPQK